MKATRTPFQAGLKLVEMLIVVVIIGLLAAIASPNFVSARGTVQAKTRVNFPRDLTPHIGLNVTGSIAGCPTGGICSVSAVGVLPAGSLGDLATSSPLLP